MISISRLTHVVLAALIYVSLPSLAASQSQPANEPLNGRVLIGQSPVADVEVELHRVTPTASGVVDRARTDGAGAFAFQLPPPDTAGFTVFFATARHDGVRYFGEPLHQGDSRSDYEVQVFDTTSSPAARVRIARRDMVMMAQPDGGWEVNEIVRISNPNDRTVVSSGGLPTAEVDLPPEAAAFEASDGDAPSDQLQRMGERVLLLMPLLPGDREVFFRYRLPQRPSRMQLGMRSPADTLNLFVRQPAPALTVDGLVPVELVTVEGERFLQYSTPDGGASALRVGWPAGGSPVPPVTAAIALVVVVFGVGGWAAMRNRSS